jgi:hypothetical protein
MHSERFPAPTHLITGIDTPVGAALTAQLMRTAAWNEVLLLARGPNPSDAFHRVVRGLSRFCTITEIGRLRCEQVLAADFSDPTSFVADPRLQTIRRVVHCEHSAAHDEIGRSPTIEHTLAFVAGLDLVCPIERFIHVCPPVENASGPARGQYELTGSTSEAALAEAEIDWLLGGIRPGFPAMIVRPQANSLNWVSLVARTSAVPPA